MQTDLELLIEPQHALKKTVKSTLLHLKHCPIYGAPAVLAYFGALPELIAKPLSYVHARMIDPLLHPLMEYAEQAMVQVGVSEHYAHTLAHPLVELPLMVGASLVVGHYVEKGVKTIMPLREKYRTALTTRLE